MEDCRCDWTVERLDRSESEAEMDGEDGGGVSGGMSALENTSESSSCGRGTVALGCNGRTKRGEEAVDRNSAERNKGMIGAAVQDVLCT